MDLDGRIALVTGAGRRVGQAIATALGERGMHVAVHYNGSAEGRARDGGDRSRRRAVEATLFQARPESAGRRPARSSMRSRRRLARSTCW